VSQTQSQHETWDLAQEMDAPSTAARLPLLLCWMIWISGAALLWALVLNFVI